MLWVLIFGFVSHLFLLFLLLDDQALLLSDSVPASPIEDDDEEDSKAQPNDAPYDGIILQAVIKHPIEEADHYSQHGNDESHNIDGVEDDFRAVEGIVLFRNALEMRPVSSHLPLVLVLLEVTR